MTILEHVVTAVPRPRVSDRVSDVLGGLPGRRFEDLDTLCAVDGDDRFAGAVPMVELFAADGERPIAELLDAAAPTVGPGTEPEDAASLAIRHDLAAVPVVDDGGRLLGVFPSRAIMGVLREAHLDDIHHLAGILQHSSEAKAALQAPPVRRARFRLPWLIVGLAGCMVAASIVSGFEEVLRAQIALAFFMPMIVYLADAVGTQSEAVAVRGLSLTEAGIRKLLAGEVSAGLVIGLVLSAAGGLFAVIVFGDMRLALTVAISLLASCAIATSLGLYLPWLFHRAGSDPAVASGPIATIIQDVISLAIYFGTATVLLGV